jgi:hypothetical protein
MLRSILISPSLEKLWYYPWNLAIMARGKGNKITKEDLLPHSSERSPILMRVTETMSAHGIVLLGGARTALTNSHDRLTYSVRI